MREGGLPPSCTNIDLSPTSAQNSLQANFHPCNERWARRGQTDDRGKPRWAGGLLLLYLSGKGGLYEVCVQIATVWYWRTVMYTTVTSSENWLLTTFSKIGLGVFACENNRYSKFSHSMFVLIDGLSVEFMSQTFFHFFFGEMVSISSQIADCRWNKATSQSCSYFCDLAWHNVAFLFW